jgi:UDP-N-acetyl-D-mannosaminuronic acid dehydrogenase
VIGARTEEGFDRAAALFGLLGVPIIRTTPKEAEIAKLLTNTWRYIKFAVANQFFQIADAAGVDYGRVLHAARHRYPRTADLPGPGFAAGPCLLKDTMQLAAFCSDHFPIGHAAMHVNEGLPAYIVEKLDARQRLRHRVVGILGMAFKGNSDDPRSSLSYKLRRLLAFKGATVLVTDPHVHDPDLVPLHEVLARAEILILAAPHHAYRDLEVPSGAEVVDVWGMLDGRIRV